MKIWYTICQKMIHNMPKKWTWRWDSSIPHLRKGFPAPPQGLRDHHCLGCPHSNIHCIPLFKYYHEIQGPIEKYFKIPPTQSWKDSLRAVATLGPLTTFRSSFVRIADTSSVVKANTEKENAEKKRQRWFNSIAAKQNATTVENKANISIGESPSQVQHNNSCQRYGLTYLPLLFPRMINAPTFGQSWCDSKI